MLKILQFLSVAAFVSSGELGATAADPAECAAAGAAQTLATITKQVRKATRIRVNRPGLDPVEKEVYVLDDCARAALAAADHARRYGRDGSSPLSKLSSNRLLIGIRAAVQVTIYESSLAKWTAPGLAVRLDAEGKAFQPLGEAATPSYVAAMAPVNSWSRLTWFEFEMPPGKEFDLVLISSDGKKKTATVNLDRLRWCPSGC